MATKLLREVLAWLEDYKKHTGCKGVVLGISGGKDSTTVAMLATKVWGRDVVGVLMPNGVQADIEDSRAVCDCLELRNITVNIGNAFGKLCDDVNRGLEAFGAEVTPKTKTNLPPRLRMATLYTVAQSLGYRVIGTGNASEGYVGWTTKFGDSACDLNPLGNLTCSEVIALGSELAEEFGLPLKYVQKTPSDGLSGRSDEDNFGFTYRQLDAFMVDGCAAEVDGVPVPEEIREKIGNMHAMSAHKREMPKTFQPSGEFNRKFKR